ncbi:hypothetical protein GX50_01095 [[Emmonsia] crescens]|uniref:Uncharacterized protein n=1 Tax=[Emmonsia] crescens TaxID=73230 RepID=A0A2B7ZSA8_9EURO|nr:hypothetical protein GX50_01095 [Emmonsia crescens]
MPAVNPPTRQFSRNIAIATVAAAGFGYYIYTRSRARRGRLIQPEERQQYHAADQPQTTEGGGKTARAKEIPRSEQNTFKPEAWANEGFGTQAGARWDHYFE